MKYFDTMGDVSILPFLRSWRAFFVAPAYTYRGVGRGRQLWYTLVTTKNTKQPTHNTITIN